MKKTKTDAQQRPGVYVPAKINTLELFVAINGVVPGDSNNQVLFREYLMKTLEKERNVDDAQAELAKIQMQLKELETFFKTGTCRPWEEISTVQRGDI